MLFPENTAQVQEIIREVKLYSNAHIWMEQIQKAFDPRA